MAGVSRIVGQGRARAVEERRAYALHLRGPMAITASFRHKLARRLLQIAAAASPLAGCSGLGDDCGDPIGAPFQVCFAAATVRADAGTDAGAASAGCPSADQADTDIRSAIIAQGEHPSLSAFEVKDGPTSVDGTCCYTVQETVNCFGRPFLVDGQAIAAEVRRGEDGWLDTSLRARLDGLGAEARATLAAAWTKDGRFEHASVASFNRFAFELLAAGAPAELIELAFAAALDEVRHARLCLGLASAYAGEPIAIGPFPFAGRVEVTDDLADIAARAVREGCIDETLAALEAEERLSRSDDPAVRGVLAIIAEDEARHAELAWRTVAWAVRTGGERVRQAVALAFASVDVSSSAMAEVIAPAARALGA